MNTSDNRVETQESDEEHWLHSKWRPAMGWMYFGVCIFDFVLAPILWSLLQAIYKGQVTSQWQPLTMQGAGLFHISMGAIIGISAYGRTQEKMAGMNTQPPVTPMSPPTPIMPQNIPPER